MPERMQGMGAPAIGAHPARHRRHGEIGDAHRFLLMRLREDLLALVARKQVEQFR